jgi:hypothetical protein
MAKKTNYFRGLVFGLPVAIGVFCITQLGEPSEVYATSREPTAVERQINTLDDIVNIGEHRVPELFEPEGHFYVDTQAYDSIIVEKTNYWNDYFGFTGDDKLDPNLIKAMALQESSGHPEAWRTDVMQVANPGDYALEVLANGDELTARYTTPEFRETLRNIGHNTNFDYSRSDMDPETSIEAGILWYVHKRNIYDENGNIVGLRSEEDALRRYNGRHSYAREVLERVDI